ncbi:hypothetical protein C8R44DRAFT_880535 [Mycena epipterygia]|nr:hypothetical protein C8R44DRAFT_880535 [Mycena epipterygia]
MQTQEYDNSIQDDRRNRFLPDGGGGQRAASQPPAHPGHSTASFPRRVQRQPLGSLLSSSTRSAASSSQRFASTFEDELVDPDDDIFNPRYNNNNNNHPYRGRSYPPDLSCNRSQSLAMAPWCSESRPRSTMASCPAAAMARSAPSRCPMAIPSPSSTFPTLAAGAPGHIEDVAVRTRRRPNL